MPLGVQGKCRPGLFGCAAPFDREQLDQLITSTLLTAQAQGEEILILPGSVETVLPPDGIRTVAAVLSHPDNAKYGVLHWRKYSTMCMRRGVLEDLVASGGFRPGGGYKEFIAAIRRLNLEGIDVELS